MLSPLQHGFVEACRVAHLATADAQGRPHVVPVTFALGADTLYIAIDGKPKRGAPRSLKRLANIAANPAVAVVFDRYDENWSRLGWVMLHGRAEILEAGDEHRQGQALVRARYPQLQAMQIGELPVIAIRIERAAGWGDLAPA